MYVCMYMHTYAYLRICVCKYLLHEYVYVYLDVVMPESQSMHAVDPWSMYVCMYVCMHAPLDHVRQQ